MARLTITSTLWDATEDGAFKDIHYKVLMKMDNSDRTRLRSEIINMYNLAMLCINPRLIKHADISDLTIQLHRQGFIGPPLYVIPHAVKNSLRLAIYRDFREYASKEMVYINKKDRVATTAHLQMVNGKSGLEKNLLPNILLANIPLPFMSTSGDEVRIDNIKLFPIINNGIFLPLCPWKELKLLPELYMSTYNANHPTFNTVSFLCENGETIFEFNHQSFSSVKIDIALCRDHLLNELDILSNKKKHSSRLEDGPLKYLSKRAIDRELSIKYSITIDVKVENDEIVIGLYSLHRVDKETLVKKYFELINEMKKEVKAISEDLIKNIK